MWRRVYRAEADVESSNSTVRAFSRRRFMPPGWFIGTLIRVKGRRSPVEASCILG